MLLFRSKYPFSRKKHPITAALEEMYMQVSVNPEDRKTLRVLWEAEESELPKYIRFVFGAKFSPTWAIYPLRTCAGKMLKTIRPSAKTCQRERRYGRILRSHRRHRHRSESRRRPSTSTTAKKLQPDEVDKYGS